MDYEWCQKRNGKETKQGQKTKEGRKNIRHSTSILGIAQQLNGRRATKLDNINKGGQNEIVSKG